MNLLRRHSVLPLLVFAALAAAASCRRAPAPQVPPGVQVMVVERRPATLFADFVGQVSAFKEVELRSKVSGIVEKRLFKDGDVVKEGQLLYVIDQRPYVAALDDAKAQLAQAEANLLKADQDVERYAPLVAENAVPKQTLDNATSQQSVAKGQVEARRASLRQAQLNLEDCTIESPLTGQIGLHQVDEGALVTSGSTLLATLSVNDPVYAYFSISEQEYLALVDHLLKSERKDGVAGTGPLDAATRIEAPGAQLLLSNDQVYGEKGQVDFLDRAVSPTTGTLTARAVFPNPRTVLKPGMYVKVRLVDTSETEAVLVPQKAVQETLGHYALAVVGAGDVVELRPVKLGARQGSNWLVKSGVNPGERIVVEGLLKARQGAVVKPTLVAAAQAPDDGSSSAPAHGSGK
jgi:membrane fusion protein, multidrug efflux system